MDSSGWANQEPPTSKRSIVHHSQLARYAAEMLSRGPYATHFLAINIDCRFNSLLSQVQFINERIPDDLVQFLWFDRQNTIATRKFHLFDCFHHFVAFLIAISRFSLRDWGIDERFYTKQDQIQVSIGKTHVVRIETTVKPLCHRVTLLGRGTSVIRGDLIVNGTVTPVAIKVSYPEEGRVPEQEFISKGRRLYNGEFQDHLPLIYGWEDSSYSTATIRQQLGLEGKGQARQRRIIIFELLEKVTSLNSGKELAFVWRDCLVGEILLFCVVRRKFSS